VQRIQPKRVLLLATVFLLGCLLPVNVQAQSPLSPRLFIDSIRIEGNRHTKPNIVLRELPFKKGDTCQLPQLVGWFEESKRALMNTTLFQQVTVFADTFQADRVRVVVRVRERFNIYPMVFFEPVDRNLNQWLVEQRASLRRVNYGAQLFLNNTTGVGDRTVATVLGGYTQQVDLSYERPYLDKKMKWGLRLGFLFSRNKEVNVATQNDKQIFLRDPDRFIRNVAQVYGEVQYRPRIDVRHRFGLLWRSERVADTVLNRNPNYYPDGALYVRYPRLYYSFNFQHVDYLPYPMKGFLAQAQLTRSGIGSVIDLWEIHVKALKLWPISPKWSWAVGVYAGWKSPESQPYVNRRFLGYGNQFLSGYEYYVMDGLLGGLARTNLTRALWRHTIQIPYKKEKEPIRIPVRVMARTFLQGGYVHDPAVSVGGRLANQLQYSGGLGMDLLLFYDVLFRLEYSVNRFGENGLFLHRKYPF
jgi:outer membrane protein assembly factor BamA